MAAMDSQKEEAELFWCIEFSFSGTRSVLSHANILGKLHFN